MFRLSILIAVSAAISVAANREPATLDDVRAESNLERRSERALQFADRALDRARAAYDAGRFDEFKSSLAQVREAAELSYSSLQQTGKAARRSPKYFKRAEQRMLRMLRKLNGLEQAVGFEDRAAVADVRKRVSDLHDQILTEIMTKKK